MGWSGESEKKKGPLKTRHLKFIIIMTSYKGVIIIIIIKVL